MSDDNTFESILDNSWEELPDPVVLPDGTWRLRGRNYAIKEPDDNTNGRCLFFYSVREPHDDVPADLLDELPEDYDFADNQVVHTVWIEKKSDWRKVENHLQLHGIDTEAAGSVRESLDQFKASEIDCFLKQNTFKNKAGEYVTENEPSGFKPVE